MKKNKRFIIGALVLLLSTSLYLFFNLNKVALKLDVVTIEYGEKLNFENKDILTTTDSKVLESLKIDQAAVDLETGKNYPKVGKYNLVVTYTENNQKELKERFIELGGQRSDLFIVKGWYTFLFSNWE